MGWSLPNIPVKNETRAWSPWICLLIILTGIFCGLVRVVLHSPVGGLPSLASGYWLPLTMKTLTGIAIAITAYSLWWETQAVSVWNWNEWRQNMHNLWRARVHQHLFVVRHVTLSSDPQLLPRLVGVVQESDDDSPPLTVLPDEQLTPGISRFEQLCRVLSDRTKGELLKRYPSGHLTVLVQTSTSDNEQELQVLHRLWNDEQFPWTPEIHILSNALPYGDWNQTVLSSCDPVLVLALHYRQPGESLPEFASALLFVPGSLLAAEEQKTAIRLFRAMPLNSSALLLELKALRDMGQQSANKKHLVWHSGLPDAPSLGVGRILNELSLPLYSDIGTGGVIDFDAHFGGYGGLSGWLMVAVASEMTRYGVSSQWLLCENENESWAVTLGNCAPVMDMEPGSASRPPFPAGSVMLALLFNAAVVGIIQHIPSLAFSWTGIVILLFSLIVTLPGIAFLLRHIIARVQHSQFIKAARQSGKE
ncbi:hypothetical protein [Pluralibacter sp.]|uniref:hypothetical protein n=1 Tax=Pluralibacter sp. TaxID=1920032 RepID=UPI0025F9C1FC|nr:hypothetical protein [Pluralibacter sp.]MBV8041526.1 hypothetical protein [Pluralibacter sp.]